MGEYIAMSGPFEARFDERFSNQGVLQTTVAELITVKEHQRKRCLGNLAPSD